MPLKKGKSKKPPKINGGPERKAYKGKNITPVNFSRTDPFWDIAPKLMELESKIRTGEIKDLVVIYRDDYGVGIYHRGNNPLTTALGMCEYGKYLLMDETR